MHVCTALRSKTSPIGCGGTRHRQGAAPEPGSDRTIRVGVLSRLPFTTLDPDPPTPVWSWSASMTAQPESGHPRRGGGV